MLTTQALVDQPLLVGRLRQHRRGPVAGMPCLILEAWCPACRDVPCVAWPSPSRPDSVIVATSPCRRGPWVGSGVAFGLDPERMSEHRKIMDSHAAAVRRFEVEQRFRHQLREDLAYARSLEPRRRRGPAVWGS
jgi:hypothetical protein